MDPVQSVNRINHSRVRQSWESVLAPAPGVTVEQMLADAQISGAQKIVRRGNTVVVTWYDDEDDNAES